MRTQPFYRQRDEATLALALRPREAAIALGVSPSTLERLTRAGAIPVVMYGRCRLYEIEELKRWLNENRTNLQKANTEEAP